MSDWHVKCGGDFPFSWLNWAALQEIGSSRVFARKGFDSAELFYVMSSSGVSFCGYSLGGWWPGLLSGTGFPCGCLHSLAFSFL